MGSSHPLILDGDFNTTDQSQTYQLFDPILKNAHWQAGWWFSFICPTSSVKFLRSFPLPPLVRIDHIFHSKHFITQKVSTLPDSGGSDHFPVIAELILKTKNPVWITSNLSDFSSVKYLWTGIQIWSSIGNQSPWTRND